MSPGCRFCYARAMAKRQAGRNGYPEGSGFAPTVHHDKMDQPLRWKKPARVFVCSMGDLFHADISFRDIANAFFTMFGEASAEPSPEHTYLVLTKRPERANEFFQWLIAQPDDEAWLYSLATYLQHQLLPSRVWMGTSVENQEYANKRIPELLRLPAINFFLSIEPMLGPIELRLNDCWTSEDHYEVRERIKHVIVGGESGIKRDVRPCHPGWVRSIRDQCADAGVPFLFKQHGEWLPEGQISDYPDSPDYNNCRRQIHCGMTYYRVGKKVAGRLLDGKLHDEYPTDG